MPKQQPWHGPKSDGVQLRAADIRVGQMIWFTGNADPEKSGIWQVLSLAPEPSTFWLHRYSGSAPDGRDETVKAHLNDLRSKSVVR